MNILYLNHYAGSPQHGMEFRPYYLAQEWVRMGHHVTIVAADYSHLRYANPKPQRCYQHEMIDGIHYIWCRTPVYQGNGIRRVINIFTFLARLIWLEYRHIHPNTPDIIIASSTYPLDMLPAAWMARRAHAKLVYEVHDLWPLTPIEVGGMSPRHPFIQLMQWAEDFAYRRADVVVSMLPCAKDYMVQHGMAPEKYRVIPNGIRVADWQEGRLPLPEEQAAQLTQLAAQPCFLIGYAGGHGLANALDGLIEAAAMLQNEAVAFVLLGDGPDKAALMDAVRQRGLTNVYFLSTVPKQCVPTFLSKMDALYLGWRKLPIYRFGINPNKLFDYMMAAKPIIHAVTAGNDSVAEAGAGLSVAAEDPAALACAIRTLLAMPVSRRDRMGQAGKAYVMARHDYRVLAPQFLAGCGEGRLPYFSQHDFQSTGKDSADL